MDSQKQQVSERIKQANNILVTVSSNPSVDQLSACIGLTLALNKMGKHATAVFSGAVPSTIEFLQPEKTIERNTDSLRDFIIALDKSKADKLRYKVEDKVVKIFITPYRTSISNKDLEFSQGDFNVDVVVALGVHDQNDLDQAITAHGRILHDATVISVNIRPGGELGSVNWVDPAASSLSELATQLVDALDKKLVDNQIATSLLTGIVAETDRFSNAKTSPQTMSISAELMAAGANQQLVASKLEEPVAPPPAPEAKPLNVTNPPAEDEQKPDDGTLEITHDGEQKPPEEPNPQPEPPKAEPESKPEPETPQIHIDEHGSIMPAHEPTTEEAGRPQPAQHARERDMSPHMVLQPPTFDSQLTASAAPAGFPDAAMTLPQVEPDGPLLNREPLQTPSIGHTVTPPSEEKSKSATDNLFPPRVPDLPDRDKDTHDASEDKPNPTLTPLQPSEPEVIAPQPTAPAPVAPPMPPLPEPHQAPMPLPTPPAPLPPAPAPSATLSDIERNVNSPHLSPATPPAPSIMPSTSPAPFTMPEPTQTPPPMPPSFTPPSANSNLNMGANSADLVTPTMPEPSNPAQTQSGAGADLDSARDAVNQAINDAGGASALEPIQALNAQSLGGPLHNGGIEPPAPQANPFGSSLPPNAGQPDLPGVSNASFSPAPPPTFPQPTLTPPPASMPPSQPMVQPQEGPGAPPPVPPPMLPPVQ